MTEQHLSPFDPWLCTLQVCPAACCTSQKLEDFSTGKNHWAAVTATLIVIFRVPSSSMNFCSWRPAQMSMRG